MKKFFCSVALIWTLAASPNAIQAQQTRTVRGVVQDSATGETLPNASVSIVGSARVTRTNRDGFFALIGVSESPVTVAVRYIGYRPFQMLLPSGEGNTDLLRIQLEAVPLLLEEISVMAEGQQLMDLSSGISHITASPREMALLPNIGEVDIFRSLQLLPGISGSNESSSGLFVRGGTPDQNLVLLDGMTVYHVDHFFGFFSAFNADAIKDVQVYKGAFPARYGERVSSVVDMTGKTGDPIRPHMSLGANLLSAQFSGQVPLWGRGSAMVSARRSYTDIMQTALYNSIFDMFQGEDDALTGATPQAGGPGGRFQGRFANADAAVVQPVFYFYDVNSKVTYRPTELDVLSVTLYNGQDFLDNSRIQSITLGGAAGGGGGAQPARAANTDIADQTDWGNNGISGKWARQWNPRFYSNALLAYSEYFSDYNRTTVIDIRDLEADTSIITRSFGTVEDNLVRDFTFRLDNEWQLHTAHKLEFGTWLARSGVNYSMVRDDTLQILDLRQEAWRLSGYVQDSWTPIPTLQLDLGLRVSSYDATNDQYFEPRASVLLRIGNHMSIKAAFGRYHQFVNRVVNDNVTEGSRDFWILSDGDLVDVMESDHYVVGASYETSGFLFDVEAYRKNLNGLSEFSLRFRRVGDVDLENLFFGGTAVAQGIEVLAQKKFGAFTGWVAYTLASVEHTFEDLNEGMPFPALHDQTHEFKSVGTLNLGRWSLSSTWTFATGKPYTAPESEYTITLLDGREQTYIHVGEKNGLRLPDYHRLDLAAHYRFDLGRASGDIGFSIFNAYGRRNIWYREFDLTESPMVITDVTYLGLTPNFSVRFEF